MADPLCLPKTIDGWEEMRNLISECIKKFIGPHSGITIREKEGDDSIAFFFFSAFSQKTGKFLDLAGAVGATWNDEGKTFLNVVFDKMEHPPVHLWLEYHEWEKKIA